MNALYLQQHLIRMPLEKGQKNIEHFPEKEGALLFSCAKRHGYWFGRETGDSGVTAFRRSGLNVYLDEVQGVFGRGPILGAGPGPRSMPSCGLRP